MADVRLLFPSLYLAAHDLRGRDVNLTIARVVVEDLRTDKGAEKKPVIYFRELEKRHSEGKGENKRVVLNKTNAKTIAKLHGFETDQWKGKRIALFATTCQAFGQIVDCLRVRDVAPPSNGRSKPKPEPESAGGDPFDSDTGEIVDADTGELTEEQEREAPG